MDRPSIWARYTEKAVYLKFLATWCALCIKQMPHFEQTFQNAGPDLAVIAFNAGFNDTPADVREFQKKHGIAMPMVIDDGQLGETFNLRVTPLHVIIGRDGRIQYVGHFADERLENAFVVARSSAAMVSGSASAKKDAPHYKVGESSRACPRSLLTAAHSKFASPGRSARRCSSFSRLGCESYLSTSPRTLGVAHGIAGGPAASRLHAIFRPWKTRLHRHYSRGDGEGLRAPDKTVP